MGNVTVAEPPEVDALPHWIISPLGSLVYPLLVALEPNWLKLTTCDPDVPFAAVIFPDAATDVAVAAPIFGVTSVGVLLRTLLPVPVLLVTPVPP